MVRNYWPNFLATNHSLTCPIDQVNNQMGNNLPDQLLVESILRGNTNAFAEIVRNTRGLVTQIVCRMISNMEDRKDISQDIYLKAFNSLRSFRFQSKLSTWIGQIAYNTCLNYLEKKKLILPGKLFDEDDRKSQEISFDFSSSASETEILIFKREMASIVQSSIESLTPIHRTMITLYHQEELSYHEIGQIMKLPEGTVKSYLFRARKALKENLLSQYKREEI